MMASLNDKVVLITGASSGIGESTAVHLAQFQPRLVLTGRNKENLEKTKKLCETEGLKNEKILLIVADLEKEDDTESIVKQTIDTFGQLDVLINNAGISHYTNAVDTTLEWFDRIMRTNLRAPFHLSQLCTPHLIKTKGCIVNVSSELGRRAKRGIPNSVPECSKENNNRLEGIKRLNIWHKELAKHKIRVNSVNPTVTRSNIQFRAGMTKEEYDMDMTQFKSKMPFGVIVDPIEVAKAITFLASDDSSFITGENLLVDGGYHLV